MTDALLAGLRADFEAVLVESLIGIYVHGSLAFGCFRRETSDVDFIAVVERPPTLDQKAALIRAHAQHAAEGHQDERHDARSRFRKTARCCPRCRPCHGR